jgi:hypothetical protein
MRDTDPAAEQPPTQGPENDVFEEYRKRILHALDVFPFISASMIHQAIGTSTPTALWRPLLEELEAAGKVVKFERSFRNPMNGRMQPYTIYHLPNRPYIYGPSDQPELAASA